MTYRGEGGGIVMVSALIRNCKTGNYCIFHTKNTNLGCAKKCFDLSFRNANSVSLASEIAVRTDFFFALPREDSISFLECLEVDANCEA